MSSSQSPSGEEQNVPSKGKRKTRVSRKEEEVFCLCRQPEGNRFMIGCDKCDEWYHGDCVSITRAMGKQIHQYYCKACIDKDPTLVITYEKQETDESITKRCIECMNCLRLADCGNCFNCKKKRGRCLNVKCIKPGVAAAERKMRQKLKREKEKNQQKSSTKSIPSAASKRALLDEGEKKKSEKKQPSSSKSITSVPSKRPLLDEGEKKKSEKKQPSSAKSTPSAPSTPGLLDDVFDTGASTSRSKEEEMPGKTNRGGKKKQERVVKGKGRETQKQLKDELDSNIGERPKRGAALPSQNVSPRKDNWKPPPMRCPARGCTKAARANSKYCSESCGMALARERLLTYLPQAAQSYWRIEPVAMKEMREEEMRRKEEEIALSKEMVQLDKWYALCINFVEAIKTIRPDEKDDDQREADISISCPVCAGEYTCKTISRHLEKCFAKQEKQSTYGTSTKYAVNPNNIFCEEFNKSNQTYCKRLRVICPEHYKGDIEAGLEVCGWPKAWSQPKPLTMAGMFTSVEDIISLGTCGISRKDCKQHSGWIPAILGTIDSRRMAHFTRMDELLDISVKNQKRGDAILLMSNQTEYHQPLEKIIESYNKGRKKSTANVTSTVL